MQLKKRRNSLSLKFSAVSTVNNVQTNSTLILKFNMTVNDGIKHLDGSTTALANS